MCSCFMPEEEELQCLCNSTFSLFSESILAVRPCVAFRPISKKINKAGKNKTCIYKLHYTLLNV